MTDYRALLAYWTERLELSDREVSLEMVPQKGIPGCDMEVCFLDREAMRWLIKIRRGRIQDAETVLVHELLHVRTGLLDARDEKNLWVLARALVGLKYAKA